jgi:hypothetical protein
MFQYWYILYTISEISQLKKSRQKMVKFIINPCYTFIYSLLRKLGGGDWWTKLGRVFLYKL